MNYTLKVEQNEITGEYFIILPEDLLAEMDWKSGDEIEFKLNNDNSITLVKVNTQTTGATNTFILNYEVKDGE
jgi:bifunctional DNA-binding transcriptional regulator/antitoxin component of YhaV-PrlF toxin-antitoxin module